MRIAAVPAATAAPTRRNAIGLEIFLSVLDAMDHKLAWEASGFIPKMTIQTQSRCARSVPSWELQAPENAFNLATLLQVLEECDEECVLTVRKIHKLGLGSAQILRDHFSFYGEVDRVMLLPSRPKSSSAVSSKIRPASMGFVVMRSRQPAIIARLNDVQMIIGHPIQVQKFKRDPSDEFDVDYFNSKMSCLFNKYSWLTSPADEELESIATTPSVRSPVTALFRIPGLVVD